jgi:pimeloyl-ACP methyl ester carboxylesterase
MTKTQQPTKNKWFRKALLALLIILIIALAGFFVWANNPLGPMPESVAALQSDANVQVDSGRWIIFEPLGNAPTTGLIFYPGGRVDARSYAPEMRAIAEDGYLAVIVPMPLNLAVLDINRADQVIAAFPQIQRWALAGHSLGGAMAASYIAKHPGVIDGLVLWASYPASGDVLSNQGLRVTSIYGTSDGMATSDQVLGAAPLLPADTRWVPIEGGNHGQFGWYGNQPGDLPAAISRHDQHAQIIAATLQNLQSLSGVSP